MRQTPEPRRSTLEWSAPERTVSVNWSHHFMATSHFSSCTNNADFHTGQQSVPEDPCLPVHAVSSSLHTWSAALNPAAIQLLTLQHWGCSESESTHLSKAVVTRASQLPPTTFIYLTSSFPSLLSLFYFFLREPQIVSRFSHIVT